ncbi:ATP-dependent RNA/DNA helicase IGHMBP2 [Parabacteroides sp. PFB2-10]|uniref:AAA domain-containing protein n=1 Tax=Parabacteroides sp. PFB2-10 TaxID=1742405 RepID=UPI002475661D|nr:AAA domain-containing protein [Parabacteroides sp. PFB2-10]MDH6314100.1 ATP-dependent RNA/DNA helicase IGHMBP2 [Parabacteroides sp. PFB2-10]
MQHPPASALADLQKQYDLLQLEYAYEKENYRLQAERIGVERKIQQGLCWYPVAPGRSYYNSLNQLVVVVERRSDFETEHNFEPGRPIVFFNTALSGEMQYLTFTATVSYVGDEYMVVVLPSAAALAEVQGRMDLGIQLYFDETSYRIMFEALTRVMKTNTGRLAELREKLIGKQMPSTRSLFPTRFPWLNPSQESAVNKVLEAKDVAVVHGPPGTGKTTTLVEAIYETLRRENQVLVCAQSNAAVDWISEKLVDRGVNVLRIGNPTRVNEKMLSFTYERRFEAHPDYPELWSLRRNIRALQSASRKSGSSGETVRNRLSRMRFRVTELEVKIDMELFEEARVVASTLVGSDHRLMLNRHFTTLFIDEATQALEPACWIAIGKADRVILAGDHQQLPPTIKCPEAARGGLDFTLMEKIVSHKPQSVSLLTMQYRMHQAIMKFPSQWFYHDRLVAAPEVKERGILQYDQPINWIDTSEMDFTEEVRSGSMSRVNKQEAQLLIAELKAYLEKIGRDRILEENIDFGLISPYKAQVYYLRQRLNQDSFFKPYKRLISIHTVDGFQGQERDVILISLVRANETGQIGFLHDLRRMNVAITRARMKLIILGDAQTLTKHTFYRKLWNYIQEINQSPE